MTIEEMRKELGTYRDSVTTEAQNLKEPEMAHEKLHQALESLDDIELKLAFEVITEWVLSDRDGVRFDALALVDDLHITQAVTSLRQLAQRLEHSKDPGAPYEIQKIQRILGRLSEPTT
jgi:hypothetical protein